MPSGLLSAFGQRLGKPAWPYCQMIRSVCVRRSRSVVVVVVDRDVSVGDVLVRAASRTGGCPSAIAACGTRSRGRAAGMRAPTRSGIAPLRLDDALLDRRHWPQRHPALCRAGAGRLPLRPPAARAQPDPACRLPGHPRRLIINRQATVLWRYRPASGWAALDHPSLDRGVDPTPWRTEPEPRATHEVAPVAEQHVDDPRPYAESVAAAAGCALFEDAASFLTAARPPAA